MSYVDDGIADPVGAVISKIDAGIPISGPNLVSARAAQPDILRTGAGLPTADPHVSGALWSNSGVITTSAG